MSVLFVCTNNITRSQMAEAFYRAMSGIEASSAGLKVEGTAKEGLTLAEIVAGSHGPEYVQTVLTVMRESGMDLSTAISKQLTPAMVQAAEEVIVLTANEELPPYVRQHRNLSIWDVSLGRDPSIESFRQARDEIAQRTREMLRPL